MFDITHRRAQQVVKRYQEKHPNTIRYSYRKRRFGSHGGGELSFVENKAEEYLLQQIGLQAFIDGTKKEYRKQLSQSPIEVVDVSKFLKPSLNQVVMKEILQALNNQQVLRVEYHARTGKKENRCRRILSPHRIIFCSPRFHLRAYCHLSKKCLDFNLSRFFFAQRLCDEEWIGTDADTAFKEMETLVLVPKAELSAEAREILRREYCDEKGQWTISVPRALVGYAKRQLNMGDGWTNECLWSLMDSDEEKTDRRN